MLRRGLIGFVLAGELLAHAAHAADERSQYELVNIVQDRKILMFEMQDAYFELFAINRDGSADLPQAATPALLIGEKIDGFVDLLLADTAVGQVPNSRAKPEIWTASGDFASAVETLKNASALLAEAATAGDIEAFRERFDGFSDACFSCHGLRPSSDGRFRSPK